MTVHFPKSAFEKLHGRKPSRGGFSETGPKGAEAMIETRADYPQGPVSEKPPLLFQRALRNSRRNL